MDSTPNPPLTPHSSKPSASKLPIKRKNLNPSFSPILADDGGGGDEEDTVDRGQPPFKFHRIWTEPDEIRFLRGLLDCTYDGLVFPRDLGVFYDRFSGAMSQPYTKSQLSEKLRRLRKKFRVVSSRIACGLDKVLLSPHDLALFEISEQLWHPNFSDSSPFGGGSKPKKSNLVGVKVSFSPTLPSSNQLVTNELDGQIVFNNLGDDQNDDNNNDDHAVGGFDGDGDVKMREVNIGFDSGIAKQECSGSGSGVVETSSIQVVGKTVMDVFDQCLKEVRMGLVSEGRKGSAQAGSFKEVKVDDFEARWREQRIAELDVLACRLRLVIEHSLQRQ
ncbi:probable transcription factor At3g04930 [Actinidia eriantha]|uniref:probable transcription factor At3g04930 n=1 Tax=Actinidia eriantha TaxID=165200 RepID=UPI0025841D54|nr:probable transcription factor At3g04930 [Actinidia eriantha]